MKCPKCQEEFSELKGGTQHLEGQYIVIVTCPKCETVLAVLNKEPIRTE